MEPAATTLPENTATTIPMEIVRGILSTYVGYTRDELLDRRVFIKCTRLTFALMGATPIFLMAMVYLALHHGDVGGDERSTLGIILASLWQFLGALSFYRCSLWKNSLIPDPRFQSDRIHMMLITGPMPPIHREGQSLNMEIGGLPLHSWRLLCWGQIWTYASLYVCVMGWMYLYFSLALDDEPKCSEPKDAVRHCNDDSGILTFLALFLPSIVWYFVIRACHRRFLSQNSPARHQCTNVNTNDALSEHHGNEGGDEESSPRHSTTTTAVMELT